MRKDVSFCILGKFGSGKTSLVGHLTETFPGFRTVTSSGIWDKVAGRKLTHYEATLFQKKMIDERGEEHFAKLFVEIIDGMRKEDSGARFIIDGIRTRERLDAVKEYFGDGLVTIGVRSDRGVRKDRMKARDGEDGAFEDRDAKEEEQFVDLSDMVDECDVLIENNFGSKEELFAEIDEKLSEI